MNTKIENFSIYTHEKYLRRYAYILLFFLIMVIPYFFYTIITRLPSKPISETLTLIATVVGLLFICVLLLNALFDKIKYTDGYLSWNLFFNHKKLDIETIKNIEFIERASSYDLFINTTDGKVHKLKINNPEVFDYLIKIEDSVNPGSK